MNHLRNWLDDLSFYRHVGNWHKHPVVSKYLCLIGRHDYEFEQEIYDDQGDVEGAKLVCFYCQQVRSSYYDHMKDSNTNTTCR
jgi:hypothetical protein